MAWREAHPALPEREVFQPGPCPNAQVKGPARPQSQRALLGTCSLYCFSHVILNPQRVTPFNLEKQRFLRLGSLLRALCLNLALKHASFRTPACPSPASSLTLAQLTLETMRLECELEARQEGWQPCGGGEGW